MAVPDDDEHLRALTAEGRVLLAITPDEPPDERARSPRWARLVLLRPYRHACHFPRQHCNFGERPDQPAQIPLWSQALQRLCCRFKQAIQSRRWILIASPPLRIHHQPVPLSPRSSSDSANARR
jgi:hypothetical protein